MQTLNAPCAVRYTADAAVPMVSMADHADANTRWQHREQDTHLPSGWWLFPAVICGAGFWTYALTALFS